MVSSLRRACLLSLFCMTTANARAETGGVFCVGNASIFAEKIQPSGAMTFSVITANGAGNIIQINGTAKPHKGGWRYRRLSDEEPGDRCTLDIKAAGGGYLLSTFEGARCENMGGHGAYTALVEARFPKSSRIRDLKNELDQPNDVPPDVSCGR